MTEETPEHGFAGRAWRLSAAAEAAHGSFSLGSALGATSATGSGGFPGSALGWDCALGPKSWESPLIAICWARTH